MVDQEEEEAAFQLEILQREGRPLSEGFQESLNWTKAKVEQDYMMTKHPKFEKKKKKKASRGGGCVVS